jgi:gas vesicle protein
MADNYDRYESEGSGAGFMMGLLTGTVLGAGLGMLLAPKAGSELRGAIGEQAKNLGSMAQEQYKRASESANTWAEKGREFVDKTREAVSRGSDEVREYAGSTTSSGSSAGSDYTRSSGSDYTRSGGGDFNRS